MKKHGAKAPAVVKSKAKPRKERAKKYDPKVSLHPLSFGEAMDLAIRTKIK